MNKRKISLTFFCLSIFSFLFSSQTITGNIILKEAVYSYIPFLRLAGLILMGLSGLFFLSRQNLDAIIIPTGAQGVSVKRTQAATNYAKYNENPRYFLISGKIQRDQAGRAKPNAQVSQIYKELRKYGVTPENMLVEGKSNSTLENVLFSLEKLKGKGIKDLGIATGTTHYWRFVDMINKAKKEGLVDKDLRVYQIPVDETGKEKIYGTMAFLKDYFRLRRYGLHNQPPESDNKTVKEFVRYLKKKLL